MTPIEKVYYTSLSPLFQYLNETIIRVLDNYENMDPDEIAKAQLITQLSMARNGVYSKIQAHNPTLKRKKSSQGYDD